MRRNLPSPPVLKARKWSADELAILLDLWTNSDKTAPEIGKILNRTGNSILGKVHNSRYPARSQIDVTDGGLNRQRGPKPKTVAAPQPKHIPIDAGVKTVLVKGRWNAIAGREPVSLVDLMQGQCKWPIGQDAPYLFCGCEAVEGKSYCAAHYAIATGIGTPSERDAIHAAKFYSKRDGPLSDA
jgi:hypothetical protein